MNGQQALGRAGNLILRSLTPDDFALMAPYLRPVELKARQRLEIANRAINHVYFVEQGLVTTAALRPKDRIQAEVAIIGREGLTGLPVLFGVDRWPNDTTVQMAGSAQRIAAQHLQRLMAQSASLASHLMRYAHARNVQAGCTALANAHGRIDQRLARWLLMAQDRMQTSDLHVTHDFLSVTLGVRRAGVTLALHDLGAQGSISIGRGVVRIVDRDRLIEQANGLYGVPEAEFERLFGHGLTPTVSAQQAILDRLLEEAMRIQRADFGNVQLLDRSRHALYIAAHRGFKSSFLSACRSVGPHDPLTCGRALHERAAVVVEDVEHDSRSAHFLGIARDAGFRAIQSTPLILPDGTIVGMVSTHFARPHRPSAEEMRRLARAAEAAAAALRRVGAV